MSTPRAGQPGATRLCPHCKATVLESASICPGCRHHLRFSGGKQLAEEFYTALSVDGTIAHRQAAEPCEYCIVLDITNERGEQVMRQVVGVGALQAGELRRVNLSVQMLPLVPQVQPRPQAALPAAAGTPAAAAVGTGIGAAAAARPLGRPAAATVAPATTTTTTTITPAAGTVRTSPASPGGTVRPGVPGSTPSTTPGTAPGTAPGTPGGTPNKGPASNPPAASAPSAGNPAPAAPSQRLRIFRKP